MSGQGKNAAIWYADDGYDPNSKGINGRRVAGSSFLRGFFRHANVDEFVSLTSGAKQAESFQQFLDGERSNVPHRAVLRSAMGKLTPLDTVYYPSPNLAELLWMRESVGATAYSICGITHTTATRAVMEGFLDLRVAAQKEWDAIICTSRAVRASTLRNIEIADEWLKARFGHVPPRPQLPIIPLGIDLEEFAHDPEAAQRFRSRQGWGEDDIVISTIARLTPYGKFDPAPLFIALARAQARLGDTKRLHYVACGIYPDEHSQLVFEECARAFMPEVGFCHLDGADAAARKETLSGSDIFAFTIDNVQETFGLAPLEAMAAGLPVVVSDWDGLRDTVTSEVGFLIPTRSANAAATFPESHSFLTEQISYPQYGARLSALTTVDIEKMTEAFVALAQNPSLRHQMGQAGLARAKAHYDWSQVIPQMQELWSELSAIRQTATEEKPKTTPVAPLPMDLFASYPSEKPLTKGSVFVAIGDPAQIRTIYAARRMGGIGMPFEIGVTVERVLRQITQAGEAGISLAAIANKLSWNIITAERSVLFLLKYGLVALRGELE